MATDYSSSNNFVTRVSKLCWADFSYGRESSLRRQLASSDPRRNCINSSSTLLCLRGGIGVAVGVVAGLDALSANVLVPQAPRPSDVPTTGKTTCYGSGKSRTGPWRRWGGRWKQFSLFNCVSYRQVRRSRSADRTTGNKETHEHNWAHNNTMNWHWNKGSGKKHTQKWQFSLHNIINICSGTRSRFDN